MNRRTSYQALLGCGALVALPLACVLRNPLPLQLRPVALPLVCMLAVAALSSLCAPWGRSTPSPRLDSCVFGLWLFTLVLVGAQETAFHWHKHQALHSRTTEAQALGAHIIIGYSHPDEVKVLAQKGLVGRIFIGTNTMHGKTTEAIAEEVSELRRLRQDAGLPPLIVSTHQEGRIVARMSPPLAVCALGLICTA